VCVRRSRTTPTARAYRSLEEAVVVTGGGAVLIVRGYDADAERTAPGPHEAAELRRSFAESLRVAREILAEYGGHGDLRLVYLPDAEGRGIRFESGVGATAPSARPWEGPETLRIELDTTFDDPGVEGRVFAEILRAEGFAPDTAASPS
jgi:hypothetical protein